MTLTSPKKAVPGMVFRDRDPRRPDTLIVSRTLDGYTDVTRLWKHESFGKVQSATRIRTDRLLDPRLFTFVREQAAARDVRACASSADAARRLNREANPNKLGRPKKSVIR